MLYTCVWRGHETGRVRGLQAPCNAHGAPQPARGLASMPARARQWEAHTSPLSHLGVARLGDGAPAHRTVMRGAGVRALHYWCRTSPRRIDRAFWCKLANAKLHAMRMQGRAFPGRPARTHVMPAAFAASRPMRLSSTTTHLHAGEGGSERARAQPEHRQRAHSCVLVVVVGWCKGVAGRSMQHACAAGACTADSPPPSPALMLGPCRRFSSHLFGSTPSSFAANR